MLSRIISNNNESSSYPLADVHRVYPDNLIVDCCICTDNNCTAYIESVIVTDSYVTATLSLMYGTGDIVNVYGNIAKSSGFIIMPLYNQFNDTQVGWLWLGSGLNTSGVYTQKIPICSSCVHLTSVDDDASLVVNGSMYQLSQTFNIFISGDLDTNINNDSISIVKSIYNSPKYDSDDVNTIGGILTVNGIHPENGMLIISLPKHIDAESGEVVDVFTVEESRDTLVTAITIKDIGERPDLTKEFTCPDSDILLDKITTGSMNISESEYPLDAFLEWYKANKQNR